MALLKGHISKFKIRYDWFLHTVEMADGKTKSTSLMSTRLDKLATYFDILTEAYCNVLSQIMWVIANMFFSAYRQ